MLFNKIYLVKTAFIFIFFVAYIKVCSSESCLKIVQISLGLLINWLLIKKIRVHYSKRGTPCITPNIVIGKPLHCAIDTSRI